MTQMRHRDRAIVPQGSQFAQSLEREHRTFPAADAKDAYQYLASNESFGKVVLEF